MGKHLIAGTPARLLVALLAVLGLTLSACGSGSSSTDTSTADDTEETTDDSAADDSEDMSEDEGAEDSDDEMSEDESHDGDDDMSEEDSDDDMSEEESDDDMAEDEAEGEMAEDEEGDTDESAAAAGSGNCALGEAEPAEGDLTEVKIAVLPIVDVAPVYYGVECGQFAAQGLDVKIEVVDSGPAASALIVSGDVAMGVSAWHPLAAGVWNQEGQPDLKVAVDGAIVPPSGNKILVAEGSDIATLADLEGKNVAINSRAGSPEVAMRLLMQGAGANPDNVNLVVTPPGEMIAAVESGSVDAMIALEPFGTMGLAQGLVALENELLQGQMQDGSTGGLVGTGEWAEANRETLEAFRTAWAGIAETFNSNPDGFRAYFTTYTGIPKELADQMAPSQFRTTTDPANVQPAVDASVAAGIIPESYDVTPYVID